MFEANVDTAIGGIVGDGLTQRSCRIDALRRRSRAGRRSLDVSLFGLPRKALVLCRKSGVACARMGCLLGRHLGLRCVGPLAARSAEPFVVALRMLLLMGPI